MHRLASAACLLVIIGCNSGCTARNEPPPPIATISGTVYQDGKLMATGEIRFTAAAQPPKALEIRDGKFSGEAFVGKNSVDVVLEKDGPYSTTEPKTKTKINAVAAKSQLTAEIPKNGANDLKFDVTTIAGK